MALEHESTPLIFTTTHTETAYHLEQILRRINTSYEALVRVVTFLRSELRIHPSASPLSLRTHAISNTASHVSSSSPAQAHLPTLSALTGSFPRPMSKRKRSVTHYDGIPLSAVDDDSFYPSFPFSDCDVEGQIEPRRPVISRRKVMSLDFAILSQSMGSLRVGVSSGPNGQSEGRGSSTRSARSSGSFISSVQTDDSGDNDIEDDSDSESDDEEDVVLVLPG